MLGGGPGGATWQVWADLGRGASDGYFVTTNAAVRLYTFGLAGYTKEQLDAMGVLYDGENIMLEYSTYAGYTAGGALLSASSVAAWQAAGGGTMEVVVGQTGRGQWHVIYGAGGVFAHAWGRSRLGGLGIRGGSNVVESLATRLFAVRGIPVRYPGAVVVTGGTASSCVHAAAKGFVRGWRTPP